MARTQLESVLLEKALRIVNGYDNARFIDHVIDTGDQEFAAIPLKNVCAKVSVQLSDEIDQIVGLLDISKRQFLELAFVEAVNKARQILGDEGVHDYLPDLSRAQDSDGDA